MVNRLCAELERKRGENLDIFIFLDLIVRILLSVSFLLLVIPQFKELHKDMKEWSKWIRE